MYTSFQCENDFRKKLVHKKAIHLAMHSKKAQKCHVVSKSNEACIYLEKNLHTLKNYHSERTDTSSFNLGSPYSAMNAVSMRITVSVRCRGGTHIMAGGY